MTAPASHPALPALQVWPQAAVPWRPAPMRVSLAFVEHRVDIWLRFGKPVREIVLDQWRRVAVFEPGAVCCRVGWLGNDCGPAAWQLMVLQAPSLADCHQSDIQRVAGVVPGARILLRAESAQQVKEVLAAVDAVEASGIDPCTVAATYWRMVGHRLVARQLLSPCEVPR